MKALIPFILIIVSVAGFFMYINPTYITVQALEQEQEQYAAALKHSREAEQKRIELADKLNSFTKAEVESLKKLVPDNIDNIRLLIDMNGIASKYGTEIGQIGIDNVVDDADPSLYRTLTLHFSIKLSFGDLINFLHDLEHSLRLVDVTSLRFTASDKDEYTYNITLVTYWLK